MEEMIVLRNSYDDLPSSRLRMGDNGWGVVRGSTGPILEAKREEEETTGVRRQKRQNLHLNSPNPARVSRGGGPSL